MLVLFLIVNNIFALNSWISLLAVCIGVGIIGYIISLPLLFKKDELLKLKNKVTTKLKRR